MKHLISRKWTLLGLGAVGATMLFNQPLFAQETRDDQAEAAAPLENDDRDFEVRDDLGDGPRRGRSGASRGPAPRDEMDEDGPRGRGPRDAGPGRRGRGGEMRGGPDGEMRDGRGDPARRGPGRNDQDQGRPRRGPMGEGRGMGGGRSVPVLLPSELNLTAAQRAQIRPIEEEANHKIAALTDSASATNDRRAQAAEIMKSARTRVRPMLTSEQRAQLDAIEARLPRRGGAFKNPNRRPQGEGNGEFRGSLEREFGDNGPRGRGPRNFDGPPRRGPNRGGEDNFHEGGPRGRGPREFGDGLGRVRGPQDNFDDDGPRGPREFGGRPGRGPRDGESGPRDMNDDRPRPRRGEREFDAPPAPEMDEE